MKNRLKVFALAFFAICGCVGIQCNTSIVGKWEWLDVKRIAPQFDHADVEFKSDGITTGIMWPKEGTDPLRTSAKYVIRDDLIWYDDDTNTMLRVHIKGKTMKMVFVKAVNPDDVGKVLKYRRSNAP